MRLGLFIAFANNWHCFTLCEFKVNSVLQSDTKVRELVLEALKEELIIYNAIPDKLHVASIKDIHSFKIRISGINISDKSIISIIILG